MRAFAGIALILHGLVHLLYLGHSLRWFELQPGMTWPSDSWTLSWIASSGAVRTLAAIGCGVAALGFVISGLGLAVTASWWARATVVACAFSTLVYLALWNGTTQGLANQGAIGILINVAIVVAVVVAR